MPMIPYQPSETLSHSVYAFANKYLIDRSMDVNK